MICPPRANWVDTDHGELDELGHAPEICRDFGLTPQGCGCQHRPKQRVRPGQGDLLAMALHGAESATDATTAPPAPTETPAPLRGARSRAERNGRLR